MKEPGLGKLKSKGKLICENTEKLYMKILLIYKEHKLFYKSVNSKRRV